MNNSKKIILSILMVALSFVFVGCTKDENVLVVYSSRNQRFVQALLDDFTEETGIRVVAKHDVNALLIEEERNNVQADIFISNDLGALGYLHSQGLLEGSEPIGIDSIPEYFRSEDNAYFALSIRARGLIYNKDLISFDEMPKTMEDLMDSKWANVPNGFAITRGGNGGMIGNVSALRYEWGDPKTRQWVSAISDNASGIFQGHGDIRRAVGRGEHAFGLVNNYYFHQQLLEPTHNNVGFIYLDQGEGQMGAITNAAGVGLVKGAPNADNAAIFLEWILRPENQVKFVGESLELLVNPQYGAVYPEAVLPHIPDLDELKLHDMSITELGKFFKTTTDLIRNAGLDLLLQ